MRGRIPPPKVYLEYETKLHLMVKFQFKRSTEFRVLIHCHYYQVHTDPLWKWLLGPIYESNRYVYRLSVFDKTRSPEFSSEAAKQRKNMRTCNVNDSLTSWHKITLDGLYGVRINQSIYTIFPWMSGGEQMDSGISSKFLTQRKHK